MQVGYVRTSTVDQVAGLEAQIEMLRATGCTKLFIEQVSSVAVRDQLEAALDFVREGDTFCITKIDRLARSTTDLLAIVAKLEKRGVHFSVADFGGTSLNTRAPTGRMLLVMMAAIGEFERSIMLERQRAGISKAKGEGRYKGRAPTARAKAGQVRELRATGVGASAIAAKLSISRASVYRILDCGAAA